MNNKQQINRLKDMAELAWASYGYFYLIGKNLKDRQDERGNALVITHHDILDSTYKNHIAMGKDRWGQDIQIGTLKGDFAPTQAKNFFEKYDLLIHQPNTDSGFSATLFGEKKLQIHNATKEKSYTSQYGYVDYILAIRGTESEKVA